YHVFKMYTVHHDAQLIPVKFESPNYTYQGESIPAISISASKDDAGKTNISLVNIDAKKDHKVELDLAGMDVKSMAGQILRSGKIQDHNTFDNPTKIQIGDFKDFKIKNGKLELSLPPFSVVVLSSK